MIPILTEGPSPAAIPDPDRAHPAGLTWWAPLESRPILLGPSEDRPVLHPALAIDAAAFWSGAVRGASDWPAVRALECAVEEAAFTTDPYRRRRLLTAARALEMST